MSEVQYKRCSKCKQEFELSKENFYYHSGRWENSCKRCYSKASGHKPREKYPDGFYKCAKCKRLLPNELFSVKRGRKRGLSYYCKDCDAKRSNEYYYAHKDECLAKQKQYYIDNPDKAAKRDERVRQWILRNRDRVRSNNQRWQYENWEYLVEYKRQWKHNNPEKVRCSRRVYKINRAARIRGNGGKHTKYEIEALYILQDGLCKWCGKPVGDDYHIDHILPVSRGGTSFITNLCISCPKCNRLKSNLMMDQWIIKLNRLRR